jgi:hypothetical protein
MGDDRFVVFGPPHRRHTQRGPHPLWGSTSVQRSRTWGHCGGERGVAEAGETCRASCATQLEAGDALRGELRGVRVVHGSAIAQSG